MSIAVVVKKNEEIIIGCDTLTMLGGTKESSEYIVNSSKIISVGDSFIASMGHASNQLVLSNYFSNLETTPSLANVNDIFKVSLDLHKALKEDYFLNPEEDDDDPYESIQMKCLIANPSGIFGLYELRSVQEYTKFYAFGSGYKFALGAMKTIYDQTDSAKEIAEAGLKAAIEFDDYCGAPIELYTII